MYTLRPPFFSQCYVAAPFVLVASLGLDLMLMPGGKGLAVGMGTIALALIWYAQAEIRWFLRDLGIGEVLATALFLRGLVIAVVTTLMLAILIGWSLKNWSV